jgi:hypothetical protein
LGVLLSFALLFLAMRGSWRFWDWLDLPWAYPAANIIGAAILLAVIPALPTGGYRPRWSRWFILLGPLAAIFLNVDSFWGSLDPNHKDLVPNLWQWIGRAAIFAIMLAVFIARFARTPPGRERQQLKWLALAIGAGVVSFVAGEVVEQFHAVRLADDAVSPRTIAFLLGRAAFIVGILGCLFAYRLNEADEAIGRAAGYALIAAVIVLVLTTSSGWVDAAVQRAFGDNQALATGFSAAIALAIFAPARARLLTWLEARYRRGLTRLQSLPARFARWHGEQDPGRVTARAVAAIAECIDARGAALVLAGPAEPEILALHGTDAESVKASLADAATKGRADPFPLRVQMGDGVEPDLILLVGPRSDGAGYDRQQRQAVAAVGEPLADLVRCVSGRAARYRSLSTLLAEINGRLGPADAGPSAEASPER